MRNASAINLLRERDHWPLGSRGRVVDLVSRRFVNKFNPLYLLTTSGECDIKYLNIVYLM
jgi:hypothetical protein